MKQGLLFMLLLLGGIASSCAEIVRYDNNYQGVRVGASTLEDVERLLGKPLETLKTFNGHNYRFDKVVIN